MAYSNFYPNYYQPQNFQQNYPQNYPQNFQQPMSINQNQQNNGIIWVGSEMEAANYLMAPNSAVALWNSNSPCIYLKQTDASGRPTMKTYDLVERSNLPPEPPKDLSGEYVTRKEFDALRAKFEALTRKEDGADGKSV